jgi:hypothetical protein
MDAGLADWIGAHTRVFEAIGGVPKLLVPDNVKVAVIKAGLRAADQPQLRRDGGALRDGHSAGSATPPARQSESRGGGGRSQAGEIMSEQRAT